jgi:hypothetical protein
MNKELVRIAVKLYKGRTYSCLGFLGRHLQSE